MAKPVIPEIILQQRFYGSGDSLYLLLRFEDVRQVLDVPQTAKYMIYSIRAGASERDALLQSDSVNVTVAGRKDAQGLVLQLALPRQLVQEPNVLHLRLWQDLENNERMGARFKVPLQASMPEKDFLLVQATNGQPVFQDYTTTSTPLLLRSYSAAPGTLMLQRFEADFTPALPPMSARQEAVPRTISVLEETSIVPGDTFSLKEPGLYLLAPDSRFPRGLLVQPNAYPKVTMAKELLPPLIYLTTSAEREAMMQAADTKEAVDRFWLKIAGNENEARRLIRTYYSRVETANRLYTSHKAGWATDRGMIYIIYGPPSDISHTAGSETWIYRQSETSPYVKFVFTKKENTFTTNHYELIRRPEYEESWYSTVAKWRAGITGT
ncbi:GWxTD domain-containing protein [Pontibacter sp. 172403-2]|uniref:GWxTD domain-containing protein n=1 Tax=Pontibacter rufus TaxID=2791028 RepID=UPI0018AFDF74|nr:GWxTD domain-containing protein [Pontibacter sp. 172403-2]MBF9252279.1 GWxTD domain-containing protein [Pontibacter sp. 172403-2]